MPDYFLLRMESPKTVNTRARHGSGKSVTEATDSCESKVVEPFLIT